MNQGQRIGGMATVTTNTSDVVVEEIDVPVINRRVRGVAKRRTGLNVAPAVNTPANPTTKKGWK